MEVKEKASSSTSLNDLPRRCALFLKTLFWRSPATKPGKIAFTLILSLPNSIDKDFVNPITPHFAEAYGVLKANPYCPAADERLTIDGEELLRRYFKQDLIK